MAKSKNDLISETKKWLGKNSSQSLHFTDLEASLEKTEKALAEADASRQVLKTTFQAAKATKKAAKKVAAAPQKVVGSSPKTAKVSKSEKTVSAK